MSPAKIPVISNVTGDFLKDGIASDYWSAHVRQPVLFHRGMRSIIEAGGTVLIEVGPHPALTSAITGAFDAAKARCVPTLMRDQPDVSRILQTVGSLYVHGVAPDLERVFPSAGCRRVPLPMYPFRRDRHWLRVDHGFKEVATAKAATTAA